MKTEEKELAMEKRYILFDLDGTLTDSQQGIFNAVEYALRHYGITVEDKNFLRPFLGPPLSDSMMKYCGFDRQRAEEAVELFREYYHAGGMFENQVYPGVEQLLSRLRARDCRLYVATSKPEATAREILAHFGLDSYFSFIGGATMDDSRVKKGDVIRYVLETCKIRDLEQALMVGDRKHDILGAKENGLESVGVLYGYGSREELVKAGADVLAVHPEDILSVAEGKTAQREGQTK